MPHAWKGAGLIQVKVKGGDFSFEDRAAQNSRNEHVGKPDVHSKHRASVDLFGEIHAPQRLSEQFETLRVLQDDLFGDRQRGCFFDEFAIAQLAAARVVQNNSFFG